MLHNWRHNTNYVCAGSMRVFRTDIDTNPSVEYTNELLDYVCKAANEYNELQEEITRLKEERDRWYGKAIERADARRSTYQRAVEIVGQPIILDGCTEELEISRLTREAILAALKAEMEEGK